MKFQVINNEQGHISLKGYQIISDAQCFWDEEIRQSLIANVGNNYVDGLFDDLYDGFEPICQGDDGKLYTVLFRHIDNELKPFIWQEVKAIDQEVE